MDPITSNTPGGILLGIGGKLIDTIASFIPNPEEKLKATLAMQQQLQAAEIQAQLAQLDIDKAEAASGSVFMGGWRSAIGWVCALAFAWTTVGVPMIGFFVTLYNMRDPSFKLPVLPQLDTGELMTVMGTLLGMGGWHYADLHSQRTTGN